MRMNLYVDVWKKKPFAGAFGTKNSFARGTNKNGIDVPRRQDAVASSHDQFSDSGIRKRVVDHPPCTEGNHLNAVAILVCGGRCLLQRDG